MLRFAISLIALAPLFSAAPPPPLQPVDESGYQKIIAASKGKVLLIDFWATYCKPCRAEMPQLLQLETRLAPRGVKVITVSADEPEMTAAAAKFALEVGVKGPAYIRKAKDDDKFINFVDPKWSGALPALMVYDKAGKLVKSFYGETPLKVVEAAVTKLL